MIRMSKLTDYAIVMMTYLAVNSKQQYSAQMISDSVSVPLPTVRKVLKILSSYGLLISERGVAGGFRLAKPANVTSIAEIVTALEGPIALTECVSDTSQCEQEPHCAVQANWSKVNQAVFHALDKVKLSDMMAPKNEVVEHSIQWDRPNNKYKNIEVKQDLRVNDRPSRTT